MSYCVLVSPGCVRGRYGPGCTYDCVYCKNKNCDPEGYCLEGCEDGYTMKKCDIAYVEDTHNRIGGQMEPDNDLIWILVVALAVFGCISVVVMYSLWKRRIQKTPINLRIDNGLDNTGFNNTTNNCNIQTVEEKNTTKTLNNGVYVNPTDHSSDETDLKQTTPRAELLIEKERMTIGDDVIGTGNFGEVRKATLRMTLDTNLDVVIKIITDTSGDIIDDVLQNEINVFERTGTHPNIVHMFGVYKLADSCKTGIVMEYFDGPDLRSYLHMIKPNPNNDTLATTLFCKFMQFSLDIASGMNYLANKRIFHQNLAARNVFLENSTTAKVSDYGLSSRISSGSLNYEDTAPFRWTALEVLKKQTYSSASDIWSFGVVLWEIFSYGAVPYSGISKNVLVEKLSKGERLEKPKLCTEEIFSIMSSCWCVDKSERPSFQDIMERVMIIMEKADSQDYDYVEEDTNKGYKTRGWKTFLFL
ncbi:hypothetical protein ScPMuIL_001928 [Solemya velum]